jgi:hypothetical protein
MNLVDNQGWLGNFAIGTTVHFMFTTNAKDGESVDNDENFIYLFKNNSTAEDQSGLTVIKPYGSVHGLYDVTIVTTGSPFWTVDTDYTVILKLGLIDTEDVMAVLASFSIGKRV